MAAQYMEYERSANSVGRTVKAKFDDKRVKLWCMVNPCNPTGEHIPLEKMKKMLLDFSEKGTIVLIDESMLMWHGPSWLKESFVSQQDWVEHMSNEKGVHIFVVTSWTKIWACPGLRIGSVVAPTERLYRAAKRIQVPWSVNGPALAFLHAAVLDEEYLHRTWAVTEKWRNYAVEKMTQTKPKWTITGEKWLSFLWINTHSEEEARTAVSRCLTAGVPLRWGLHGYELPTYIRIAVREPRLTDIIVNAIKGGNEKRN
eukprot:Selendium_serpulae@DN5134_c0_g1_i1.p1